MDICTGGRDFKAAPAPLGRECSPGRVSNTATGGSQGLAGNSSCCGGHIQKCPEAGRAGIHACSHATPVLPTSSAAAAAAPAHLLCQRAAKYVSLCLYNQADALMPQIRKLLMLKAFSWVSELQSMPASISTTNLCIHSFQEHARQAQQGPARYAQ